MDGIHESTHLSDALALRPKEAAKRLGISPRKLWDLTQPRGPIRVVRVGSCCLYPVEALRAWLNEQANSTGG
jgi:excisionase family DNA binding protein